MTARHWVEDVADRVETHAERHKFPRLVCASGISPSGPIHLGNLREVLTAHFVAEELRRRGHDVVHLHSWDDFDRLRKVPAGVPGEFISQVGKALCSVPDPEGVFPSFAERNIATFVAAIDRIGCHPTFIRQSIAYGRGDYRAEIISAMRQRATIFDVLAKYQTAAHDQLGERRERYYPLRIYCSACARDTTEITSYDDGTLRGSATCSLCQVVTDFDLQGQFNGKLVWKVDWPMRWAKEKVVFEPGGEDHSTPGGSLTVGSQLVDQIFGGAPPLYEGYAFVGATGASKLSSSAGTTLTPEVALTALEPSILRWIYARRKPNQRIVLDFGNEVVRLYDEMDVLRGQYEAKTSSAVAARTYELATQVQPPIAATRVPVSFRVLSALADVTQDNEEQMMSLAREYAEKPLLDRADLEPRFSCALAWGKRFVPATERTRIRATFSAERYQQLSEEMKRGVQLLLDGLEENWNLEGLRKLVYGVPKTLKGLPMTAEPTTELKESQRQFFIVLYTLLCDSETGPRLPLLLFSIGIQRVRELLDASAVSVPLAAAAVHS